jgi:hypothetical protein
MKKITLGVFVFSAIALLGVGLVAAFPFDFGKMNQDLTEEEQTEIQAFHDSLKTAIENEDYESWKSLMESQITEENFNKIIENQKTMQEMRESMEEQRAQFCEENECPAFEEGKSPGNFDGRFGRGHMSPPVLPDSE